MTFWLIYLSVCLVASLASFCAYGLDKYLAKRGMRRIPEKTLLTLDVIGGWPGGMLGRKKFRHKTSKQSYRLKAVAAIGIHVVAVAFLLYSNFATSFTGHGLD